MFFFFNIRKWKKNDKIFAGKYSTGATPKIQKQRHPLPLLLEKSQSLSKPHIHNTLSNNQ